MKRLLALTAVAGAALVVGVSPALSTNECKGLQICLRVAGPWVVVPGTTSTPRPTVSYQLSCPRGFIVGGLDAELSDRAIDVGFRGALGSPVNPGITTARAALFDATFTGRTARAVSFRPHLGCIPTSGGSGGPQPFLQPSAANAAAFAPGRPTVRRVSNVTLRAGSVQTVVRTCAAGEHVVSGWHAVGFYTTSAPSAALITSVATSRTVRNGRVTVRVRTGFALAGVRAVVQVGAVCAGGS